MVMTGEVICEDVEKHAIILQMHFFATFDVVDWKLGSFEGTRQLCQSC